ncbi:hypothetical protein QAD02_000370 [Eretmocerus hayati]|uniref:Uncharacterized protein n=1 Tax=Eretmocerus hayati TaxID=131215 RepID=A0ACC2NDE9_9HYME|nr:hypothetical protein QAD02_000370 [Eretmocerus hayati]
MGVQLSVLVGCVGAVEIMACMKHVLVCKLQLADESPNCCVNYFHRPKTLEHSVEVDSCEVDNKSRNCSQIEAILRETRSEPDILCLGPPTPAVDGYVRLPTPIPFGVDTESGIQNVSSNASSLIDSGNENPTKDKLSEKQSKPARRHHVSSSDISSLEEKPKKPATQTESLDGTADSRLVRVSSFEQASEQDHNRDQLRKRLVEKKVPRDWSDKIKSSLESESEYVDAEEVGFRLGESPIQFTIPDHGDSQASWVIQRNAARRVTLPYTNRHTLT